MSNAIDRRRIEFSIHLCITQHATIKATFFCSLCLHINLSHCEWPTGEFHWYIFRVYFDHNRAPSYYVITHLSAMFMFLCAPESVRMKGTNERHPSTENSTAHVVIAFGAVRKSWRQTWRRKPLFSLYISFFFFQHFRQMFCLRVYVCVYFSSVAGTFAKCFCIYWWCQIRPHIHCEARSHGAISIVEDVGGETSRIDVYAPQDIDAKWNGKRV